jgi:hypothetical protein
MSWRPARLGGLSPFGFEISLIFKPYQKRIERPGFYTCLLAKLVAVSPAASCAQQGGHDQMSLIRELSEPRHRDMSIYVDFTVNDAHIPVEDAVWSHAKIKPQL